MSPDKIAYVFGNHDHNLPYDFDLGANGHHLHGNPLVIDNICLVGFSGCPTNRGLNPISARLSAAFDREEQTTHAQVLADLKLHATVSANGSDGLLKVEFRAPDHVPWRENPRRSGGQPAFRRSCASADALLDRPSWQMPPTSKSRSRCPTYSTGGSQPCSNAMRSPAKSMTPTWPNAPPIGDSSPRIGHFWPELPEAILSKSCPNGTSTIVEGVAVLA